MSETEDAYVSCKNHMQLVIPQNTHIISFIDDQCLVSIRERLSAAGCQQIKHR